MKITPLTKYILAHSEGVGRFMAAYAESHPGLSLVPAEMYVVGLLHDIGKIMPGKATPKKPNIYKGHARKGGKLLADMWFPYWREVNSHGHPEDKYDSVILNLLNLADLSIDRNGNIVPVTERLEDIRQRYGDASEEYGNARKIYERLIKNGFIKQEGYHG